LIVSSHYWNFLWRLSNKLWPVVSSLYIEFLRWVG
jgi:hypothetical protein